MKYAIPDATFLINKKVKVIITKNRFFIGILKSTDAFFNLNLSNVIDEQDQKFKTVVLRGEAIQNIYSFK
ncbi:hypothetical protein M153_3100045690 [Pseudoloma neurophilia]|uniref:Sm domain-containing protein n=1 Tax=Pseudoloma neurophilia TaxID=146866 RepID=A0A0R0M0R9_9MICR|nr:hypothetical protein M153_3100045690 [Pseudoloma neurophilia]